ncbi:unconventional myosin-XIX-like isoform X2 [Periplaneta americana]|uniref:unconventional myosin-XIX-like isoform X2 n=1 Tax=Periplaneta americana TaxID=6978 RepID=UPI0037E82F5D
MAFEERNKNGSSEKLVDCIDEMGLTCNNLNVIPWKSEDKIVKYLESRFLNEEYYTWAGLALVAINPCKKIPSLYSEDVKELYNSFGEMLAGLRKSELMVLYLSRNTQYKIVPGPITAEDHSDYIETSAAMTELGIEGDMQLQIAMLLAAIIHLGNISFVSTGDIYVVDQQEMMSFDSLKSVSQLLGLEDSCLIQLLTSRQIVAHGQRRNRFSVYWKPAGNVEECNTRRDCLMRFLYERLFRWIVSTINANIKVENGNFKELGILDIYGFEMFENNSLEQLCINYANERLQHFFVENVLMEQKRILQDEGLEAEVASYYENQERLKLLDAPVSVFGLLNEECTLQRYSSDVLVCERIVSSLRDNKYFLSSPPYAASQFIIKHYAGEVCYDVHKMLEKNMDKVPREMISVLGVSSSSFVRQILQHSIDTEGDTFSTKCTLLSKFKTSLDDLINILKQTDVHYIRCVKATPHLVPGTVYTTYFKQQLQASGILEAVLLCQQRFPIMLKYHDFTERYGKLLKAHEKRGNEITTIETGLSSTTEHISTLSEDVMKDILCSLDLEHHVLYGRFTLFLSETALLQLEVYRHHQRQKAAQLIQRSWKKHLKRRIDAAVLIQQTFRKRCTLNFPQEGDVKCKRKLISEPIENKCNESEDLINLPKFVRLLHFGDGIISRQAIAKIPVRFHTRRTCMPNSHVLPFPERSAGLEDLILY